MFNGMVNESVRAQWIDLVTSTDGSEPCFDSRLLDRSKNDIVGESEADLFTETWSGALEVESVTAEKMCGGCHVYDQCRAYAINAKERYGVWGGTTPADRGYKRRYKAER